MNLWVVVATLLLFVGGIFCDTPANCTFESIRGDWVFSEGERESNSSIDCSNFKGDPAHVFRITLDFPNVASDELGNKGYWTIVYNQGFEVVINYRKYFAFSLYKNSSGVVTSYCDWTLPGWSHDVLGENWACYVGHKVQKNSRVEMLEESDKRSGRAGLLRYPNTFVDIINKIQKSWTAAVYPEYDNMSPEDMLRRFGGVGSRILSPPKPATVYPALRKSILPLPKELDWRNVNGISYVSPVRNQGQCGSCYAFSSLGMLEARLRIMTNNSLQVQLSPQDIVSCSKYSQGCDGGFPYVIAGKYGQDFGIPLEECDPYQGHNADCPKKNCKRYYVADYKYVGGFFGGCNEELMKLDILQNGPVTVAMQVYPDFAFYKGGIYHHTGIGGRFNPFHTVNHGVLIVGYGESSTGEKYWIVKNSWGEEWGENGFFRIRRGTDECNIESMAVSAIPIP